jgi:hypothetical protein
MTSSMHSSEQIVAAMQPLMQAISGPLPTSWFDKDPQSGDAYQLKAGAEDENIYSQSTEKVCCESSPFPTGILT